MVQIQWHFALIFSSPICSHTPGVCENKKKKSNKTNLDSVASRDEIITSNIISVANV